MALSKIQSESVNLADNFAFTGTVSGAGGQVHLITHTVSDAVAQVIFNETYINSTYDNYLLIAKWFVSADSSKLDFQFRQQDGTAINDSNYIRNIAQTTYGSTFTGPTDSAEIAQNLGVGGGDREHEARIEGMGRPEQRAHVARLVDLFDSDSEKTSHALVLALVLALWGMKGNLGENGVTCNP